MWVKVLWDNKGKIAILVGALLVLGYIALLKGEIGDLKGIVADYKIEMNKANIDIQRVTKVNRDNNITFNSIIKDYDIKLDICEEKQVIQSTKEADLLSLIEALRNKKPKIVETTVYKLKECKVTVNESKDSNASTLLNRLNKNFGGM